MPRERLSEENRRKSQGSQVGLCPPPGEAPSVQDKSKVAVAQLCGRLRQEGLPSQARRETWPPPVLE